jgi:hypothetical protein
VLDVAVDVGEETIRKVKLRRQLGFSRLVLNRLHPTSTYTYTHINRFLRLNHNYFHFASHIVQFHNNTLFQQVSLLPLRPLIMKR